MIIAMLFIIFTVSVVVIELIVRHDARQRAKGASAACADTFAGSSDNSSLDLLRLAQALGGASQPGSTPRFENVERPDPTAVELAEVMVRRSR